MTNVGNMAKLLLRNSVISVSKHSMFSTLGRMYSVCLW